MSVCPLSRRRRPPETGPYCVSDRKRHAHRVLAVSAGGRRQQCRPIVLHRQPDCVRLAYFFPRCRGNADCRGRGKKRTIALPPSRLRGHQPRLLQENSMSNHVYKHIELTGSSTKNIEDAVSAAIAKASLSLRNIHWFEVVETRGHVEGGKVAHWQVTIKAGFTLED